MIGKWNASVLLTYLGVILSVMGMVFALSGKISLAFVCLIWAGIVDLLDGPVARRMKRTQEEKQFGIMVDTVADVVNFLVLPVIIAYGNGLQRFIYIPLFAWYIIMGLARLSDFSMEPQGDIHSYKGLPVTYAALIFPFVYLLQSIVAPTLYTFVHAAALFFVGLLFIIPIRVIKPKLRGIVLFALLAIIMTLYYLGVF